MALLSSVELDALRIERIVLHEVGPQDADFNLFNGVLEVQEQEQFFLERLSTANQGSSFVFTENSTLRAQLKRIEDDADVFEIVGKEIATAFQQRHRRQSIAGTLVVFQLVSGGDKLFAITKFDSQQVVSVTQGENAQALLSLLQKTIVKSNNTMQKSALIRLSDIGGSLAVLDRHSAEAIPIYFQEFLGAEREIDQQTLTKSLNDALIETAREHRELFSDAAFNEIPTRSFNAISQAQPFDPQEETMLTAVYGVLPRDSPIRETFRRQLIDRRMEDESFTPDPAALQAPSKRRIKTREGIRIAFSLDVSDNVEISPDRRIITIRTAAIDSDVQT